MILTSLVNEIDNRLINEYDNPLKREDYLSFLNWFNTNVTNSNNEFFFDQNKERINWGRFKFNNKMVWKMSFIIDNLLKHNIIFRSQYRFGDVSFARTYQYAIDFIDAIDLTEEVISNTIDIKLKSFKTLPDNPQYQLLISDRFTIDRIEAMKYIIEETSNNTISKLKALKLHTTIDDIHYKNIFTSIGESSNRVFTSFTSLNKHLRYYCRIDNKPLKSVDLKSSQAYFLLSILKKEYSNKDIDKLYDIVTNGDLYEYINGHMKCYKDRDETKKEFYHFLYKGNKGYVAMQSFFKTEFEGFYNALLDLNRKLSKRNTNLSVELQKIESDIFINVCNKFINQGCLSVHDSLYFIEDIRDKVLIELNKQFSDKGFTDFKLEFN